MSDDLPCQQGPQSLYGCCGRSPSDSPCTPAVRVSISSLIGPSASPAQTGLDSPDQQKSQLSSLLGSGLFDPPQPCRPLYCPRDSVLVPMGSAASRENPHSDASHLSGHLSRSREISPRCCGTLEQCGINPHVTEDVAADSTTGAQHRVSASDFPFHLAQLPSQLSTDRRDLFNNPHAKTPLFLPSQTPNRDPFNQDILSPSVSNLTRERRYLSQDSPMRHVKQPHTDCPLSDTFHTSAFQHVETGVHLDIEGATSYDSRSLPASTFTTSESPIPPPWPDGVTTDACPRMPPAESTHGPLHHQSASFSNILGKSGRITHEAIPLGVSRAQSDIEPSEASVRAQTQGIIR